MWWYIPEVPELEKLRQEDLTLVLHSEIVSQKGGGGKRRREGGRKKRREREREGKMVGGRREGERGSCTSKHQCKINIKSRCSFLG